MHACMCASPYCAVNGCQNLQQSLQRIPAYELALWRRRTIGVAHRDAVLPPVVPLLGSEFEPPHPTTEPDVTVREVGYYSAGPERFMSDRW